MRRIALLATTVLLSGCSGFDTFFNDTHWLARPNQPLGNSENMLRVRGIAEQPPTIMPEPGNVWPGPIPPQPTLQQLMREENQQMGKPLPPPEAMPGEQPAQPQPPPEAQPKKPPPPRRGSSTPPGSNQPPLPPLPGAPVLPAPQLPKPPPGAHVYQTPAGTMLGTPGPGGYETLTTPRGESGGIVVPNGNGTSTLIMPNGQVLTVPTPK